MDHCHGGTRRGTVSSRGWGKVYGRADDSRDSRFLCQLDVFIGTALKGEAAGVRGILDVN